MAGDHPGAGFAGRPGKRPKALGNAGLQNSCFDNKILTGGITLEPDRLEGPESCQNIFDSGNVKNPLGTHGRIQVPFSRTSKNELWA